MRLSVLNEFLTFVLLSGFSLGALASPTTQVTPQQLTPPKKTEEPARPLEKESLQLAPSPQIENSVIQRLQPSRIVRDHSWNFAYGLWSGYLMKDQGFQETQVASFTRTVTDPREFSNEFGADVTTSGYFGGHWEYKSYCCLGEWNEPYWTVGAAGLYQPWDLLAGFVKYESYQIQAGFGFEDLLRAERRLRIEFLAAQSAVGFSFIVRLGYALDDSILSF